MQEVLHGNATGLLAEAPGYGDLIRYGITVPALNQFGFAHGCIFIKVNGTGVADGLYLNVGSGTLCNFVPIGASGSGATITRSAAASVTLDATHSWVYTGAGGATWTLPDMASNLNNSITVKNAGTGGVTIAVSGADHIFTSLQVTSLAMAAGDSFTFTSDGANWNVQ